MALPLLNEIKQHIAYLEDRNHEDDEDIVGVLAEAADEIETLRREIARLKKYPINDDK